MQPDLSQGEFEGFSAGEELTRVILPGNSVMPHFCRSRIA